MKQLNLTLAFLFSKALLAGSFVVGVVLARAAYKEDESPLVVSNRAYKLGKKAGIDQQKKVTTEAWKEERRTYKHHPMNGDKLEGTGLVWGAKTDRFAKCVSLNGKIGK